MDEKFGTVFKVLYLPKIDIKLKSFIKANVSHQMEEKDGDTKQYIFGFIVESLSENEYGLTKEDQEFINYCSDNNIDYIEL